MIYELAKTEDLQTVYDVVQHTIKTIYPKYYPVEVVDFFCEHHNIKEIAKENDIPVIQNIPLARALFNDAEIDKAVPSKYFRAIAELLVSIMNTNRGI